MRITNPTALATLVADGTFRGRDRQKGSRRGRPERTSLRRRVNHYTLWAFNPQRELTSRYDRAA
ncbi:MAG: hypothetical protein QM747_07490 [Nocardioides sp.]